MTVDILFIYLHILPHFIRFIGCVCIFHTPNLLNALIFILSICGLSNILIVIFFCISQLFVLFYWHFFLFAWVAFSSTVLRFS